MMRLLLARSFASAAALTLTLALTLTMRAQEGPIPTQVLVNVDAKSTPPASASALTVTVDGHKEPLISWTPVLPAHAQVALLIDDGLRESMGRELDSLEEFVRNLPPGVEILVGYMQNGSVQQAQPFTTDHAKAASTLHLPEGIPGASASPYFCLSDFVKHWPGAEPVDLNAAPAIGSASAGNAARARFAIMITNGVDPYNGSTSVMNQNSPYVESAVTDSQRAGVAVYAIYFSDAGIRGGSADNSGQNYLADLTQRTGGVSFWDGVGNPVSTAPYLKQFQNAIAETYIATFNAPAGAHPNRDLVNVKFSAPKTKLRAPEQVRAGNVE